MIKSFNELYDSLKGLDPIRPAIAAAAETEVLGGIILAMSRGMVTRPFLTGSADCIRAILIEKNANPSDFEIVDAADDFDAAEKAVKACRDGVAGMMVKGSLKTELYLKAILDKDKGIRSSKCLSNMSLFEMPSYHKLLGVTDNAIIPQPTLDEKKTIIENTKPLFTALGIDKPKVAVLAALETVNSKMPATTDAACLMAMMHRGQIKGFIVDGPLGYDAAMSRECAISKNLTDSAVAGDPDLLLAPSLESANMLGKSYKLHGDAIWGGVVFGASVPVVMNSRSDDEANRFNAILAARAAAMKCSNRKGC